MSDEDKAEWQEAVVAFPAAPVEAELLPFEGTAAFKQRFAVDAKSMTLGADGVVRYTLVSYSADGVRNVSYEGIRCETYESRVYALGRADGTWSVARRSQWQRIVNNGGNSAQATLAQDYVCVSKANAGNARDMVRRLQLRQSLIKELIR